MRNFDSSEWNGCCRGCPSTRLAPCRRTKPSDTAILVEYPTALEQAKKTLLGGDSGNLVKTLLRHYGLEPTSCFVTTAVNCRPNAKKEAMMKKAMLGCRERVLDELKAAGVERVLCLGSTGLSQLAPQTKGKERMLPITKLRGRWERYHDMDVLATFNPSWLFGEPDYFRDFCFDIEKFCTTDPQPSPNLEVWEPESLTEMHEAFDYLEKASFTSCDIETTGISVFRDKILAIGFGALFPDSWDGISVIIHERMLEVTEVWERISRILSNAHQATVFHNAKFDLKFIRKILLELGLVYAPEHIEDTMLENYCLDERPMGRFKSHSLKNMSRVRCDAPDYDIEMGKWLKEWEGASGARRAEMRKQMHEYLAFDCYFTARMHPDLVNEIMEEDPKLMDHYQNTLLPATHAMVEVESYGARVDRQYFEKTWADLQERAAPILERLRDYTGLPEFNPNSPKQVAEYLYNPEDKGGLGLPVLKSARRGKLQEGKTSKVILKMLKRKMAHGELADHTAVIDDILEYRNLVKNAGTYVKGLLQRMDTDDRIRSDFLVHGTSTGRISSSNPNLQNIPEKSHTKIDIRAGYTGSPGYLMFNADFSQLELRVAFHLSDDAGGRQVYIDGRDLHQEVVFALYGTSKEETTPYMRYLAKCMSFGALYCRGPGSLANGPEMDLVEDQFGGTRWTIEEAKDFFDKWFANFPDFKRWSEEIGRSGYIDQYVQTPFGNKRRFPFIPRSDNGAVSRQAINTPIQGTAALITLSAFTRIHSRFKELNARLGEPAAFLTLTVHDSIMGEFLPQYLEEVQGIVIDEMENNCPIPFSIPLKADFEAGPNWSITKDWDIAENLPVYLEEQAEKIQAS
jgi:uracil-DNA glycosylase family 4